jgi:type IV pilus assembly protein PilQ
MNASLPKNLQRRLYVVDFGTPIDALETTANGENTRMVIAPRGNWDHVAYQTGNQFILEVRKISDDSTQLVAGGNAGEKLTLNFQNIEVRALLQVLADFTGLNLITSDKVTGTVTLRLKDVPWDQALDIILQSKNLDFRKNGNVLMVGLRDELASRERLKLESKEQFADFEPLVTETVQLNYITSVVANTIINDPKAKLLSRRGSAISDARNNIIFLQDTNARVQELKRILKASDIPVRQVMIESRIVEASNQFNKNLGVRLTAGKISKTPNSWAVGGNYDTTAYRTGRIDNKPTSTDETFFDAPAPGVGGASAAKIAAMLVSPRYGALLGLEISALQFDGKGRTISSPRVITSDKTEAVIEQGTEIPYQQASASGATAITFKKATLSLRVKPQITPNDDVIMTLKVNKDSIGIQTNAGPSIDTKQVSTEVLVENGGTVVIGGIFTQDDNDSQAKVPMLGDLPGVGVLFRNSIKSETRKELLVFITPKIMRNNAFQR